MEEKNLNIDQILRSKSYNELSKEELLAIQDSISSESEFNDLKAMLLAATKELESSEEIEPKTETKAFLMKEFSRVHPATQTHARSGGLGFLFPKGKAFYQKPGYQLIAVAAVVVLIFTIFTNTGDLSGNEDVAQHSTEEPQQKDGSSELADKKTETVDKTEVESNLEQKSEQPDTESTNADFAAADDEMLKSLNEQEKDLALEDSEGKDKESSENSAMTYAETVDNDLAMAPTPAMDEEVPMDRDTDDGIDATVATGANMNEFSNSGNSGGNSTTEKYVELEEEATSGTTEEIAMADEMESLDEVADMAPASKTLSKERTASKKADSMSAVTTVKKVKSLAENAELIDLFYTAM